MSSSRACQAPRALPHCVQRLRQTPLVIKRRLQTANGLLATLHVSTRGVMSYQQALAAATRRASTDTSRGTSQAMRGRVTTCANNSSTSGASTSAASDENTSAAPTSTTSMLATLTPLPALPVAESLLPYSTRADVKGFGYHLIISSTSVRGW
ncbi:hypothetical protein PR003_g30311 [Phytophthora rubi]|uniref:Uncharacterized protein n=1 Tax=Phytophthora rubi TaxID=129364 RepID=A0A6A4BFG0_9STRA|nr:hypothetical protein PR003_g30311 [Phytophthora rubi]